MEDGQDSDCFIPYHTGRYCASSLTLFSPFEFVCWMQAYGPLDIVTEKWEASKGQQRVWYHNVLTIQEKLTKMAECFVRGNLARAQ